MDASQTHKLNVAILSRKMAEEAWYNTYFSRLAGTMTINDANGMRTRVPAPNAVIQMMRDFVQEGRDNMLMPMELDLVAEGTYGDAWLKGTGEDLQLKYLQIYINQHRKAVNKLSGKMANQRLKIYNMMERAKPALVRWWAKTINQAIAQTIYEGVSPNLSAGTNDEGLGLVYRMHPNWYCANTSTTDKTPLKIGATAKKTKVASDFTNYLTSALVGGMSGKTLMGLNELITSELLIDKILTESGDPFWLMLVTPEAFTALKRDAEVYRTQDAAFNTHLMKHPALSGKQMIYFDGFAIIPDPIAVRRIKTASTNPSADLAGTDGWMKPQAKATYTISNNIVLGANALGMGLADPLQFTEEKDDHGNVIEIGSNQIYGFNRCDFFSEADSGSSYAFNKGNATKTISGAYDAVNQSSMIFSTEE